MSQEVIVPPPRASLAIHAEIALPRVIAAAGDHAARRFIEFFTAAIRNCNTRLAYARAVKIAAPKLPAHYLSWGRRRSRLIMEGARRNPQAEQAHDAA